MLWKAASCFRKAARDAITWIDDVAQIQGMNRLLLGSALMEAGRGGIARVARLSAQALLRHGVDLSVVTYLDKDPPDIAGSRGRTARGGKIRFAAQCHEAAFRADTCLFDTAGIARGRPRLPGLARPYAVFMHGIEAWEALRPIDLTTFRSARLVIANSHYTLRRFETLHGALPNARVCWLSTEQEEPPPSRLPQTGRPPTAMILGRIDKSLQYKGHHELIAAWTQVVARIPDARLVMAGGGDDLENVRAAATASPVSANIDVLGFVPESGIDRLWQTIDCFVMPCRGGGFGLVYVEAMRHGLPCIASTEDAGQEVNIDGVTGFNVAIADIDGLADRLIRLLSDTELAKTMGAAGYERWRTHFRPSQFGDRLVGLMTEARLIQPERSRRS